MHGSLNNNHSENTRNGKETRSLGQGSKRFKERTFGFERNRKFDIRRGALVRENFQKILLLHLEKKTI